MQLMRSQRTILMLAIGVILTVPVIIAAASGGLRLAPELSATTDAPPEVMQSNPNPGSTGSAEIGSTEPNSTDSPPPTDTAPFSLSATSETNPSSTAMLGPTEDQGDIPTSTVTVQFSPSATPKVEPSSTPIPTPTAGRTPTFTATIPPAQGDNQLLNPYFEGKHSSTEIPGWVNSGQWDVSIKGHNPSPNETAARINVAKYFGDYTPGETAVLYQVVGGGGPNLTASIACVQHYADVMQVTILGSETSEGPWTPVWQPFDISDCGFGDWGPTLHAETQLPQAWAYYQFQIVGRFEDESGGVKVTDASLSVQ